ncbi:MAG: cyclophilin-like fold protein [Bacilli bacterium]|jgi:hypothetical protein|nr:cyclophilin-like fold protein [Bacilli bacterium]
MKKTLICLVSLALLSACGKNEIPANHASVQTEPSSSALESQSEFPTVSSSFSSERSSNMTQRYIATIGEKSYVLDLEDSDTGKAFKALLPLNLEMTELNGNEKYHYLDTAIRQDNPSVPAGIHSGDLMLFGNSCIVLFYRDFQTSYSYVRLGKLENPKELSENVGPSSVNVTFAIQ